MCDIIVIIQSTTLLLHDIVDPVAGGGWLEGELSSPPLPAVSVVDQVPSS